MSDWTRDQKLAFWALVVSVLGTLVAILYPEVRNSVGLRASSDGSDSRVAPTPAVPPPSLSYRAEQPARTPTVYAPPVPSLRSSDDLPRTIPGGTIELTPANKLNLSVRGGYSEEICMIPPVWAKGKYFFVYLLKPAKVSCLIMIDGDPSKVYRYPEDIAKIANLQDLSSMSFKSCTAEPITLAYYWALRPKGEWK